LGRRPCGGTRERLARDSERLTASATRLRRFSRRRLKLRGEGEAGRAVSVTAVIAGENFGGDDRRRRGQTGRRACGKLHFTHPSRIQTSVIARRPGDGADL